MGLKYLSVLSVLAFSYLAFAKDELKCFQAFTKLKEERLLLQQRGDEPTCLFECSINATQIWRVATGRLPLPSNSLRNRLFELYSMRRLIGFQPMDIPGLALVLQMMTDHPRDVSETVPRLIQFAQERDHFTTEVLFATISRDYEVGPGSDISTGYRSGWLPGETGLSQEHPLRVIIYDIPGQERHPGILLRQPGTTGNQYILSDPLQPSEPLNVTLDYEGRSGYVNIEYPPLGGTKTIITPIESQISFGPWW